MITGETWGKSNDSQLFRVLVLRESFAMFGAVAGKEVRDGISSHQLLKGKLSAACLLKPSEDWIKQRRKEDHIICTACYIFSLSLSLSVLSLSQQPSLTKYWNTILPSENTVHNYFLDKFNPRKATDLNGIVAGWTKSQLTLWPNNLKSAIKIFIKRCWQRKTDFLQQPLHETIPLKTHFSVTRMLLWLVGGCTSLQLPFMFALWQNKAAARAWAGQQRSVQGRRLVLSAISTRLPRQMSNEGELGNRFDLQNYPRLPSWSPVPLPPLS